MKLKGLPKFRTLHIKLDHTLEEEHKELFSEVVRGTIPCRGGPQYLTDRKICFLLQNPLGISWITSLQSELDVFHRHQVSLTIDNVQWSMENKLYVLKIAVDYS